MVKYETVYCRLDILKDQQAARVAGGQHLRPSLSLSGGTYHWGAESLLIIYNVGFRVEERGGGDSEEAQINVCSLYRNLLIVSMATEEGGEEKRGGWMDRWREGGMDEVVDGYFCTRLCAEGQREPQSMTYHEIHDWKIIAVNHENLCQTPPHPPFFSLFSSTLFFSLSIFLLFSPSLFPSSLSFSLSLRLGHSKFTLGTHFLNNTKVFIQSFVN